MSLTCYCVTWPMYQTGKHRSGSRVKEVHGTNIAAVYNITESLHVCSYRGLNIACTLRWLG